MEEVHFQPAERQIFKFHNGQSIVASDPLVIRGQLRLAAISRQTTMDKLIDAANVDMSSGNEMQIAEGWQAAMMLKEIGAEVFQLTPEADMAHALGVIDAFYRYLEKKNPPAVSPPTSTPSTASISETLPTTITSSVSS